VLLADHYLQLAGWYLPAIQDRDTVCHIC